METEGRISRSVKVLDLRSVKDQGAGARRALMDARRSAIDALASPQQPRPSTASNSSVGRSSRATPSKLAVPRSPGSPAAAAAASAALAAEAQAAAANARARCSSVEAALSDVCRWFGDAVSVGADRSAAANSFYAVTFGPGAIGMILTAAADGTVEVAELRHDAAGMPLMAKASGHVSVGDAVLAINDTFLAQYGTPSLEAVAALFKASPRPCRVLFRRAPGNSATD